MGADAIHTLEHGVICAVRHLARAPTVQCRAHVPAEVIEGAAHVVSSFARGLVLLVTRFFGAHFVAVETATQGALFPTRVCLHFARVRIPTRAAV